MMEECNVNEHSTEIQEEKEDAVKSETLSGNGNGNGNGNDYDYDQKVEDIASSIREKLRHEVEAPSVPSVSIFKVPDSIRRLRETDFEPDYISIGPYHHGKKNLQAMEQVKLRYMQGLLDRKPNPQTVLEHMVEQVREMEEYCRACYNDIFGMSSEAFVEMMLLDGCFIIEFFRKIIREVYQHDDDPIFKVPLMWYSFYNELSLLENQLPWRLVDCLFALTHTLIRGTCKSLAELAWRVDDRKKGKNTPSHYVERIFESKHLLDTMRILSFKLDDHDDGYVYPIWISIPSATELLRIGVQFEQETNDQNCIQVDFCNGIMKITPVVIDKKSVLMNLLALEECGSMEHKYQITSFVRVLHDLVKSTEDAELLMQKGIILTRYCKEDVVSFLNISCSYQKSIHINLGVGQFCLEVDHFYSQRWVRRLILGIKRDYLYNPASIWSVSNAVFFIIILTFISTLYTVLSYYKKS